LRFVFPRPRSHYRTGKNQHLLRDSAPIWHATKPDVDKLCRAVFDSLSGVLIQDDSQIASLRAEKVYADPEDVPGVHVALRPF
jgi:crossover junction endodeoxyribonuclease RusA